MFAVLVCASVLLGFHQEAPASSPADPAVLDQLIERSRAVMSFSATYRMSTSEHEDLAKIRLDFRAPDELRMDLESDTGRLSTWARGDVYDVRGDQDGLKNTHLDFGPIRAELRPVEEALTRNFPSAESNGAERRSVVILQWSFNPRIQKNDLNFTIGTFDGVETSLGWLSTLKSKHVEFQDDGEHLRCSTDDGRFEVTLSKSHGFVERLFSRNPESGATGTIDLESVTLDQPVDTSRFEVPPLLANQGSSGEATTAMARTTRASLRERIWRRAANACTEATVEPELRAKFEATLRPLQELMCHAQYDDWMAGNHKRIDEVAEYLRKMDEAGSSDEKLDEIREKYRSEFTEALDKTADPSRAMFEIPTGAATAGCATRLLEIEKELAQTVFRDVVRQPLLDEFDRATKTD